jgi:hypothetical protein
MKRVFISYGDERTVRLQSDNPDKKKYPDEVITREQLNELHFVGRLESAWLNHKKSLQKFRGINHDRNTK